MKIYAEPELSTHKYELPGQAITFHGQNNYFITLFRADSLNEIWLVVQDRLFHVIKDDVEVELKGNVLIVKPTPEAAKKLNAQEMYYIHLYSGVNELSFIRRYLEQIFSGSNCFKCILATAPLAAIAIEKDNFKWVQNCGFIAGTLVHTDQGLIPIEQLKVGDRVLALSEATGEQRLQKVKKTFRFEEKAVYFMKASAQKSKVAGKYANDDLVASAKQLLSNTAQLQGDDHIPALWRSMDAIDPGGAVFNCRDGASAATSNVALIWRTETEGVGWINLDSFQYRSDSGYLIDLRAGKVNYVRDAVINDFEEWFDDWDGDPDDCCGTSKCTVFNIEVEQDHTYFVGQLGVWVHDISET